MPVISNGSAIITNANYLTAGGGSSANLPLGGQYGLGNTLPNLDAATPLVLPPVVGIVMHAPTMFNNVPNMNEALKALMERHARNIEGIDLQYTMDASQVPAGQDGQELNIPTNSRRAPVQPTFTFGEVTGNMVWNFFRNWMRMIKDPDTQASSLAGIVGSGTTLQPHVLSMYTMDMLFIQYDTTLQPQNIIDAWFISNMWPNDIGPAGFKRTIGSSETPERQIQFHGVVQHNSNTFRVGQAQATALSLHTVNYDLATPISTSVDSALANMGLLAEVSSQYSQFGQVSA